MYEFQQTEKTGRGGQGQSKDDFIINRKNFVTTEQIRSGVWVLHPILSTFLNVPVCQNALTTEKKRTEGPNPRKRNTDRHGNVNV